MKKPFERDLSEASDRGDQGGRGHDGDQGDHGEHADRAEPRDELDTVVRSVVGAAIEVHRCLGPGFLESIYETALCVELDRRGIAYERQVRVPIMYKGSLVGEHVMDLFVEGELVVELKTVATIAPIHVAQVLSYLKASQLRLGLVLNFLSPRLKDGGIKRVIRTVM